MANQDLLQELHIEANEREGIARRWPWLLASIGVLVALASGGYYFVLARPLAVETVAAEAPSGTTSAVLEATGYVTARREATVSAKITGKLTEVLIEEGEHVDDGQVLAHLDDTDAKAQLGLAEARVAAARGQLGQIDAQLQQARRDLQRQQELRSKRLASDQSLETARTEAQALAAQLEAQRGQVRVAEAELKVAQVNYQDTVVYAPFSGVIVAKTAQPGEIVSPISAGGGFTRTGIGTVVDMDSLEIEVDVNEAFINRVRPRQPVQAVLDAYPEWQIPAAVIAIVPTADRSKATVKVRIALKEKDARIVPEMGVRVSFLDDQPRGQTQAPRGVVVPATAIVRRADTEVVFVVDGDHVRQQTVTAGPSMDGLRLVEQGLAPGTSVVREPPPALGNGARVAPRTGSP
ncbi:MAG: efflux RND transporter periplasmic adaptor subunit [Gammaproteobacteria bacterium]